MTRLVRWGCLAVCGVAVFAENALGACPGGNESTLPSTRVIGGHNQKFYADYAIFSSYCIEPIETAAAAPFDNRDEAVPGQSEEWDQSCADLKKDVTGTKTYSVTFSASISDSLSESDKTELGWKSSGSLTGSGSHTVTGTTTWTSGSASTLTMTGTVAFTVPAGVRYRETPYVVMRHVKAAQYQYDIPTVYLYCFTHSVWNTVPITPQLDIIAMVTYTATYPVGAGVKGEQCPPDPNNDNIVPCGCVLPAFNTAFAPIPVGPPKTFTAGTNWSIYLGYPY